MEKLKEFYKTGIEWVKSTFDTKRKKGIAVAVLILFVVGAVFTAYALQPSGGTAGAGVNVIKPVDKDKDTSDVSDKDEN